MRATTRTQCGPRPCCCRLWTRGCEVEGGVSYNDPRAPQQGEGAAGLRQTEIYKVVLARCPEHVRELEGDAARHPWALARPLRCKLGIRVHALVEHAPHRHYWRSQACACSTSVAALVLARAATRAAAGPPTAPAMAVKICYAPKRQATAAESCGQAASAAGRPGGGRARRGGSPGRGPGGGNPGGANPGGGTPAVGIAAAAHLRREAYLEGACQACLQTRTAPRAGGWVSATKATRIAP